MLTPSVLLISLESNSDNLFPEVKIYNSGKMKQINIEPADKFDYSRITEIVENKINVNRWNDLDILYGFEITGRLEEGERFSKDQIECFDLEMSGLVINRIYLQNNIVDVKVEHGHYSIVVKFDKIFYNSNFLPIVSLLFNNIKININGILPRNHECYLHCSTVVNSIRTSLITANSFSILTRDFHKYNIVSGNKMKIVRRSFNNSIISRTNFINSLYFKFNKDIRNTLNNIVIKTGDERVITTLSYNDLIFLNSNEFIVEKFFYKTFLYNNIIIEFNTTEHFVNTHCEMIATNYNLLLINSGVCHKKYVISELSIIGFEQFIEISTEMYEEKVLPKNDFICAISHEEFTVNEERIISGCCFSSYKTNFINEWFKNKEDKSCPVCRSISNIWYVKKF